VFKLHIYVISLDAIDPKIPPQYDQCFDMLFWSNFNDPYLGHVLMVNPKIWLLEAYNWDEWKPVTNKIRDGHIGCCWFQWFDMDCFV